MPDPTARRYQLLRRVGLRWASLGSAQPTCLHHLSHHLIGDTSHGDGRRNRQFRMQGVHRMLLHAWRLQFPHPAETRTISVEAPLDSEFQRALDLFAWQVPD